MAAEGTPELKALAEANQAFTKQIYQVISEAPDNLFFSPISIEAVLSLVHAGAANNTAAEIQKAIYLSKNVKDNAKHFNALAKEIEAANNDVTLKFVNAIYPDTSFTIKPDYLSLVKNDYKAEINQADFLNNADGATKEINQWVSKQTNEKIKELFSPGSIQADTRLVLLNAIYFKGNWKNKFPVSSTKKGVFHLNQKETQEIDFMTVKAEFKVLQLDDCTIVQLPYQGDSVNMILVVPKEIEGLRNVELEHIGTDFSKLLENTRKREIILTMPKFKLEQTLDLKDILVKMGINDLFSHACDLSGITAEPVFASKAIQKAFIEVNEEGSEAAAATALKIAMRSMPMPPREIIVNVPFHFVIQSDNIPLFSGRLQVPTA